MREGHLPSYICCEKNRDWSATFENQQFKPTFCFLRFQSSQITQLDRSHTNCVTAFSSASALLCLVSLRHFSSFASMRRVLSVSSLSLLFHLEFRLTYFPVVSVLGTKLRLWWALLLVRLIPWVLSLERSGNTHTHTIELPVTASRWGDSASWDILAILAFV